MTWFHRLVLLGFGFLSVGVILIIAEFASRFLCPQWAPVLGPRFSVWNYDNRLGWSHIPNRVAKFDHPEFSIRVKINSDKLRDDEYWRDRTDKKRMLVLGDSFGWGWGVDVENRFSEVLEKRYSDWEIINASVAGYSTDQEYLYLSERGIEYSPDVVLLLVYENDFEGNTVPEFNLYNKPYYSLKGNDLILNNVPVPPQVFKQRLELFLMGKTYFLRQIYHGGVVLQSKLIGRKKPVSQANPDDPIRVRNEIMTYLIRSMNDLCKSRNMRLVLVSCPMDTQRRTVLQNACESAGILFLPLDSAFANPPDRTDFPHDVHWNTLGHRIAADAIEAFLLQQGIFPSTSSTLGNP